MGRVSLWTFLGRVTAGAIVANRSMNGTERGVTGTAQAVALNPDTCMKPRSTGHPGLRRQIFLSPGSYKIATFTLVHLSTLFLKSSILREFVSETFHQTVSDL